MLCTTKHQVIRKAENYTKRFRKKLHLPRMMMYHHKGKFKQPKWNNHHHNNNQFKKRKWLMKKKFMRLRCTLRCRLMNLMLWEKKNRWSMHTSWANT